MRSALTSLFLLVFCLTVRAAQQPYVAEGPTVLDRTAVYEWFRAHEWDLSLWGTFVWSANPGSNHIPNDDPFTPDLDPEILVDTTIATTFAPPKVIQIPKELRSANPNERIDLGNTRNDTFLGKDNSFGAGIDIKYFWSRYFGVGIEGYVVDTAVDNAGGAGLATFTARYPIGRFAPYIWAGGGAIAGGGRIDRIFTETHKSNLQGFVTSEQETFSDENIPNRKVYFDAQLGIGVEVRVTQHVGFMADFAWNFVLGNDESDQHKLVTTPGGTNYDNGINNPVTFPNNRAINVIPQPNANDKDFGMVRFGLTLSY